MSKLHSIEGSMILIRQALSILLFSIGARVHPMPSDCGTFISISEQWYVGKTKKWFEWRLCNRRPPSALEYPNE